MPRCLYIKYLEVYIPDQAASTSNITNQLSFIRRPAVLSINGVSNTFVHFWCFVLSYQPKLHNSICSQGLGKFREGYGCLFKFTGILPGVDTDMRLQSIISRELCTTGITFVRFLPSVGTDVCLQMNTLCEFCATDNTFVGFLPGVRADVCLQINTL